MVDVRNHPTNDRAADPLGVLRRSVADLHQEVDDRSLLGVSGLDVRRYGTALCALARVLPGVERALIRCEGGRMSITPLTPHLVDDVRSLGLDGGRAEHPVDEPGYEDVHAWWGAAYVLQGSRIGATVITDRLAADLPDVPRAYFDAAATDAAAVWARFRSAARTALTADHVDLGRAIGAARAVFEALLVEFDRVGLPPVDGGRVA